MKKIIPLGLLIVSTVLLAGCAQEATVFPMGNGVYSLVSTGAQQREAEQKAEYTAQKTCKKQHKKLVVLGYHTKYQGIKSKKDAAIIGVVGDIAGALAHAGNAGGYSSSNNNYQVTMKFRCV